MDADKTKTLLEERRRRKEASDEENRQWQKAELERRDKEQQKRSEEYEFYSQPYPHPNWWLARNLLKQLAGTVKPEVIARNQFVVWKLVKDENGQPQAEYYCPSDPQRPAKPDDPSTWSDIVTALNLVLLTPNSEFKGIAFALTMDDPFVVIAYDNPYNLDPSIEAFRKEHLEKSILSEISTYQDTCPLQGTRNLWCTVSDKRRFPHYGVQLDAARLRVYFSRRFVAIDINPVYPLGQVIIAKWDEKVHKLITFVNSHSDGVNLSLDPFNLPDICDIEIPIQWVILGFIQEGTIIAITGQSKAGKTSVASVLGRAIANGKPFLNFPAGSPRKVLYVDKENPPSTIKEHLTRLRIRADNGFNYYGKYLGGVPDPWSPYILQKCAEVTPPPVVIIDSFIAFFKGNENDPTDMRKFFLDLAALTALGVTIIIIHHTDKSATQDYRGSSDFRAAIDTGYLLTNEGGATGLTDLTLKCFASRVQVTNQISFRYSNGLFVPAQSHIEKAIEQIVREEGPIKIGDLLNHPDLDHDAYTKQDIRDAVNKMVADGTLREIKGPNNSRLLSIPDGR